ncbi:MAG TPA: DUF1156 domain-containing protein, partial [Flavobacteriales bacterium]|nr:DUF1156 domain-containing protein [Flavobacteriales bacterium]
MSELVPLSLQDAPALIESVFPAQKISFEAQTERKAGRSQTLTGLGSFWKGRKPLILVRAIILGSLLPSTDDSEADLDIFEKLMGIDDYALTKRALEKGKVSPTSLALEIKLSKPWRVFTYSLKNKALTTEYIESLSFPLDADAEGITVRWHRDACEEDKLNLIEQYLSLLDTYQDKAALCKRPEEVNQEWLYSSIWSSINTHLASYGVEVNSHAELVKQLGILRFGKNPCVGDSFSGGGSIPFEAARLGCDAYASDLNPVACMLTWGAFNIIGAKKQDRARIDVAQLEIAD